MQCMQILLVKVQHSGEQFGDLQQTETENHHRPPEKAPKLQAGNRAERENEGMSLYDLDDACCHRDGRQGLVAGKIDDAQFLTLMGIIQGTSFGR